MIDEQPVLEVLTGVDEVEVVAEAAGQLVGNAYAERGGNALGTLNTVLEEHDGGWRLTGEKYYCTGTIFSDWVAVAAARAFS